MGVRGAGTALATGFLRGGRDEAKRSEAGRREGPGIVGGLGKVVWRTGRSCPLNGLARRVCGASRFRHRVCVQSSPQFLYSKHTNTFEHPVLGTDGRGLSFHSVGENPPPLSVFAHQSLENTDEGEKNPKPSWDCTMEPTISTVAAKSRLTLILRML